MSISRQEEVIGVLWIIAGVLCLGFGYQVFGWICIVKGLLDQVIAIRFANQEIRRKAESDGL